MNITLCGIKLNEIYCFEDVIEQIIGYSNGCKYLVTPNLHILSNAYMEKDYADALNNSTISLVDGFPLQLLIRKKYGLKLPRLAGSELTLLLVKKILENKTHIKFSIIGTTLQVHEDIIIKYPDLKEKFVGGISPMIEYPINRHQVDEIVSYINENRPNVVFLSLSTPKQEILAYELSQKINYPVWILCVGAGVDFITGFQKRAPKIFQRLNLEWFYRILTNRKLIKRYVLDFIFLIKIIIYGSY